MREEPDAGVTIVTGVPRSGTSLVMQMLAAGGHPIASDGVRRADADNPRGYFELEAARAARARRLLAPGARGPRGEAGPHAGALAPRIPTVPGVAGPAAPRRGARLAAGDARPPRRGRPIRRRTRDCCPRWRRSSLASRAGSPRRTASPGSESTTPSCSRSRPAWRRASPSSWAGASTRARWRPASTPRSTASGATPETLLEGRTGFSDSTPASPQARGGWRSARASAPSARRPIPRRRRPPAPRRGS